MLCMTSVLYTRICFTRELIVTRLLVNTGCLFFERKREKERREDITTKDVERLIKLLSVAKWLAKDVGRSIVLSDDINYFVKDVGRLIKSTSNYMKERERERFIYICKTLRR